jgi:hypothetical protein
MKRKLLLHAAEILNKIPKERLDLNHWMSGEAENRIRAGKRVTKGAKCGTIACAGGWLGLTKEFNEIGLRFVKDGYGGTDLVYVVEFNIVTNDPIEALQRTFDLTYDQADALFTSSGDGDYDDAIYNKYGDNLSDRELFQHRVKKVINEAKKKGAK